MDDHSLAARLAAREAELDRLRRAQREQHGREHRRQRRVAVAAGWLALLCALAVTGVTGFVPNAAREVRAARGGGRAAALDADTLRVRELVVVDPSGTVRARVGGDLPDAVDAARRRLMRGQNAAGVLLYDAQELERGGYVTFTPSGHVGLTLDTRERMVASFLAGPDGGGLVRLTRGGVVQVEDSTERAELRADRTEGARLNVLRADQVVAQTPALTPEQRRATCAAMRDELPRQAHLRADAARRACGTRMPAAACAACFGGAS